MKRLFHEFSKIGHYSGNLRDIDNEYKQVEEEENPNEAQEWVEKGKSLEFQQKIIEGWEKMLTSKDAWSSEDGQIYRVGHSHLDLPWLWRYLQSVDKTRVTLTKACYHIENIPEFSFSVSQSVILDWCRIRYPDLFARLQKAAKTGKLEFVGGSWVEPDSHIPSGEAWVRQKLYGQLFLKKYFGQYAKIDWVPDSFGFTGSLPQILLKSNESRFMTGKLSNNDTTQFPFRTFLWESLDGSRVIAETLLGGVGNIKQTNYNRRLLKKGFQGKTPAFSYESNGIKEHPNFSNDLNPYIMELYGKGDGGHGPTGEEVQSQLCLHRNNKIKLGTADQYFKSVENDIKDRLPIWRDELYLQYHRGTLTTHSLVKRMNRYNEWTLPALESLCSLLKINEKDISYTYPYDTLDEAWKMTLLQQFHDVLPGTCIVETYDDSWDIWCWQVEQYKEILSKVFEAITKSIEIESKVPDRVKKLIDSGDKVKPILIFNPSSFENNGRLEIPLETMDGFNTSFLVNSKGEIIDPCLFDGIICPKDKFYDVPSRMSIPYKTSAMGLDIIFAINAQKQLDKSNLERDRQLSKVENDKYIEISNSRLKLRFDMSTGALISIKIKVSNDWQETLMEGLKKFDDDAKALEPGLKIQSFMELAKDFPAWNMWKQSRQNPYPSYPVKISITSESNNHITLETVIDYPSPNPEKITLKHGDTRFADVISEKKYKLNSDSIDLSVITSKYTIFKDDPVVYLDIYADFHGMRSFMKLDIPTATNASRVDLETAFAYNNRSTIPTTDSDKARWENHMHTWINIQSIDNKWGLAIINNGKYGVDYHKGYIGVSLIRGQSYFPPRFTAWVFEERIERQDGGLGFPPSWIDHGEHIIRFMIYPHEGDIHESGVIRKAHLFNYPTLLKPLPILEKEKIPIDSEPQNFELLTNRLPSINYPIELTAVKLTNLDSEGLGWIAEGKDPKKVLIVRAVNMSNNECDSIVDVSKIDIQEVRESDLLERSTPQDFKVIKNKGLITGIRAKWKQFEIKTFGLLLK
jgi:alpha-mannosidase